MWACDGGTPRQGMLRCTRACRGWSQSAAGSAAYLNPQPARACAPQARAAQVGVGVGGVRRVGIIQGERGSGAWGRCEGQAGEGGITAPLRCGTKHCRTAIVRLGGPSHAAPGHLCLRRAVGRAPTASQSGIPGCAPPRPAPPRPAPPRPAPPRPAPPRPALPRPTRGLFPKRAAHQSQGPAGSVRRPSAKQDGAARGVCREV
jgi:hypothetical protein